MEIPLTGIQQLNTEKAMPIGPIGAPLDNIATNSFAEVLDGFLTINLQQTNLDDFIDVDDFDDYDLRDYDANLSLVNVPIIFLQTFDQHSVNTSGNMDVALSSAEINNEQGMQKSLLYTQPGITYDSMKNFTQENIEYIQNQNNKQASSQMLMQQNDKDSVYNLQQPDIDALQSHVNSAIDEEHLVLLSEQKIERQIDKVATTTSINDEETAIESLESAESIDIALDAIDSVPRTERGETLDANSDNQKNDHNDNDRDKDTDVNFNDVKAEGDKISFEHKVISNLNNVIDATSTKINTTAIVDDIKFNISNAIHNEVYLIYQLQL